MSNETPKNNNKKQKIAPFNGNKLDMFTNSENINQNYSERAPLEGGNPINNDYQINEENNPKPFISKSMILQEIYSRSHFHFKLSEILASLSKCLCFRSKAALKRNFK